MAVEAMAWPTQEELEANTARMLAATRARIGAFERQYKMASETMQAKIADGTVRETVDVSDWLMCLDRLRMLEREPEA